MQLNREYEQEIDLKHLFFHLLFRWRSILIFALAGAVLLAGYKYFSLQKEIRSAQAVQQQDAGLSEAEQKLNREIEIKAKQVEELEAYLNDSLYIQMTPQGVWTASCKYLVVADPSAMEALPQGSSVDPADSILPVYTYPLSGAALEELMEIFDTDQSEYVSELVTTQTDTDENTVTVSVKGPTKESVQQGLKCVQARIGEISEKMQGVGAHSLLNVGERTVFGTDVLSTYDQIDRKKALTTALDEYKTDLQALRDNANYYKQNGVLRVGKKAIVKYALFGFLGGAFLMVCLYAFIYIISGKLVNGSDITNQYNIPVFGEFRESSSVHHNKGLDRIISKWELGKTGADEKTIYDNISALIAEQQRAKNVLLISSLQTDKLIPVAEALSSRMEDKTIGAQGSFLTNSEAITEAAKADAVILVEKKNVSSYRSIERMAETLMIGKANVIGTIVL